MNSEAQKASQRRFYAANQAKVKADVLDRKRRIRNYVRAIKEASPCTDCGLYYPYFVMQFDHIGKDKEFDIGKAVHSGIGMKRLDAEIAKCELVCANCHAYRTHERQVSVM